MLDRLEDVPFNDSDMLIPIANQSKSFNATRECTTTTEDEEILLMSISWWLEGRKESLVTCRFFVCVAYIVIFRDLAVC